MGLGVINVDMKDILSNAGSIFTGFGSFLKDVRTAITGTAPLDPTKVAELNAKALELEAQILAIQERMATAQVEVNKLEAQGSSWMGRNWRPLCGMICVIGLGWSVFIVPFWMWMSAIWLLPLPPAVDTSILMTLLVGMLGLGSLRTYEKQKGLQDKH